MEFEFTSALWEWPGQAAWCFVSLPAELTRDIKSISQQQRRGFGSIRVQACIGASTWRTSIFPDNKSGSFLLPVKKQIRITEHISVGQLLSCTVKLVDL